MNVFKIALPGKDINRASLQEEVLDSTYPSPKINSFANPPHAGIVKIHNTMNSSPLPAFGVTNTLYSFPHGYDYVPTVFGNYIIYNKPDTNPNDSFAGQLPEVFVNASSELLILLTIEADLNNISINMLGLKVAPSTIAPYIFYIRYYVMAERGSD